MTMWAKYFFGFDPEKRSIITFSRAGDRDGLLREAKPGEVIVFVGTNGEETPEHYQGMVIGAAEIGNKNVKSEQVMDLSDVPASHFEQGHYRWPEGIPMLRAWRFEPMRKARGFLEDGLRPDAQARAVPLSARDEAAVRSLNWTEVELPVSQELNRQRRIASAFAAAPSRPGPVAGPGSFTVEREAPDQAWTYAMRFGKSTIWKIGQTTDVNKRCEDLNTHVPFELLKMCWAVAWTQEWKTPEEAQAMEQRVLERLADYRTHGERVQCSDEVLFAAWTAAIVED